MRFEVGLEREVGGGDGWGGGGCACEACGGFAVGEDEDDAGVWEGGRILGVNERLEVGACGRAGQGGGLSGMGKTMMGCGRT